MTARDKLYAYAGTPSVLPESMLDDALDAYRAEVLAEAAPMCAVCETSIEWIDCPTGGWWAHGSHPVDEHDAQPPGVPSRAEVLHEAAAELDRIADRIEAGTKQGAQILRDAAGNVRYMARTGSHRDSHSPTETGASK